jgi:hypothetical protein
MEAPKKILDLKRSRLPRRSALRRALILKRPKRNYRHALSLEKKSFREKLLFDLNTQEKKPREQFFLAQGPFLPKKFSKFKFIAGLLVLVLALNFLTTFFSGKTKIEQVINRAFGGVEQLTAAVENFTEKNFSKATASFSKAVKTFDSTEKELIALGGAGVILQTQPASVKAGSELVSTGKLLASAGQKFSLAAEALEIALSNWEIRQTAWQNKTPVESFSNQLLLPIEQVLSGYKDLESANQILSTLEISTLPKALQDRAAVAQKQLSELLTKTKPLSEALPGLPALLGDDVPRRYLILFQNPDEIRPTGGFIGSVGILTLNDGFVSDFEIKDVYEIDGQLMSRFNPPEGFGFITNAWGLRDANYHPDFPTSAEAAAWLFEEAGQGTVDGVVAITSPVLSKLVEAAGGEIKIDRFEKAIPAENLNQLLSLVIESKIDGATTPKKILGEIWLALLPKLTELKSSYVSSLVFDSITNKDLQFYSSVPAINSFATALGANHPLSQTTGDYLLVVDTSISGNKSDRYTSNELTHSSTINQDGTVINTLLIRRTHHWEKSDETRLEKIAKDYGLTLTDSDKNILGRGNNIDLIKVFVPEGSTLSTAEGIPLKDIETKSSLGKTYFMFTLTTQSSDSREVQLTYTIPQKFTGEYTFLPELQAGSQTTTLEKIVRTENTPESEQTLRLGEERSWRL